MARKTRTRDGYYRRERYWYTTDPRTGRVVTTECEDLAAARLKKAVWEREAANPAHAAAAKETARTACERLIVSRASVGKATSFHAQKLGHWLRIFGDDAPLADVGTPASFDAFVKARRADGVTDHTIGKEVGCMLRVLRLSKRLGLYAGDLTILRPLDLVNDYVPRDRALPPAELTALLGALPEKRHPAVALVVGLAVRRGEAFRLDRPDLDLDAWEAVVRGTKTKASRRRVPILPPFRRIVAQAAQHLPLEPWGNYLRDLKAACKKAGIAPVTFNDLRRTHATLLRNANVERRVVQEILGHTPGSKMLDLVYDKPSPQELAARAGDLSALTRELALGAPDATSTRQCVPGPLDAACVSAGNPSRAREDSNFRPTAPEAVPTEPDRRLSAEYLGSEGGQGAPARDDDVAGTRHTVEQHALALAAARVLVGRTFMVPGARLRREARRA